VGDGFESMIKFQVQIKGHNQREYEDKWQGWQNWTDEKLATKLTRCQSLKCRMVAKATHASEV